MFLNTAVWIKVMLAILVAFVVSIALTPFVKRLAVKVGAVDVPGEARRVHDHPIPRMGGLAIFLGFIVSTLLFADITQEVRGILIGSIIIVITGVIDDIVSLRAWTKFLIQILAAVIAVLHGVVINVVSNPNVFSNQEASVLMSMRARRMPRLAASSAKARPMPVAEPVMAATLFLDSFMSGLPFCRSVWDRGAQARPGNRTHMSVTAAVPTVVAMTVVTNRAG